MSKAKVYPVDTINGTVELDIAGGYFKLMVAPADVAEIELLNDGNQALQALAVPAGFYQRIRFNKIRIRHTGAQAIKILVAPDEGGSDNFTGTFTAQGTLGTLAQRLLNGVNMLVVDPHGAIFADDISAAGQAFMRSLTIGASVGNYSHVQIHNPAGSGVVAYVDRLRIIAPGAVANLIINTHNAAITNDNGGGFNKDLGAAESACNIRHQHNGAQLGTNTLLQVTAGANVHMPDMVFEPPLRLGEGEGVLAVWASQNIALTAGWEWREKAS